MILKTNYFQLWFLSKWLAHFYFRFYQNKTILNPEKRQYLPNYWSARGFKYYTVFNQALPSLLGGHFKLSLHFLQEKPKCFKFLKFNEINSTFSFCLVELDLLDLDVGENIISMDVDWDLENIQEMNLENIGYGINVTGKYSIFFAYLFSHSFSTIFLIELMPSLYLRFCSFYPEPLFLTYFRFFPQNNNFQPKITDNCAEHAKPCDMYE